MLSLMTAAPLLTAPPDRIPTGILSVALPHAAQHGLYLNGQTLYPGFELLRQFKSDQGLACEWFDPQTGGCPHARLGRYSS